MRINEYNCLEDYIYEYESGRLIPLDNLGENVGSEENKLRPVVVLQPDAYNLK